MPAPSPKCEFFTHGARKKRFIEEMYRELARRYLAASVDEFPPRSEIVRCFLEAGFAESRFRSLWGGMATLFCVSVDGSQS